MMASLYQSASTAGSCVAFAMRLDSWRKKQGGAIALIASVAVALWATFLCATIPLTLRTAKRLQKAALFLWQRHGVRGDALPFAVPLHPRIGEPVGVRESFAGLRLAGLFRDAGNDRDVRAEHAHAHVA